MVFSPIIGTLIYLLDRDSNSVLLINRDARPDDDHYGKFNGLGGKLEVDESVIAGALRELTEEAGVTATSLSLRGTISWSNFGPKREEWLGFVFLADAWELERLLQACDPNPGLRASADLPMWEGDRHFIPLVFDNDERQFHGSMPYDGDKPLGWTYQRV